MKRLVFHIGPHKTGSTYIQRNLLEAVTALEMRDITYPVNRWSCEYGHHNMIDMGLVDQFAADLFSIDPCGETVVLSSENFDRLDANQVRSLRRQIHPNVEVVIVYFLRKLESLLYSTWQEDVKFGSDETFARFLLHQLARPYASPLVNPAVVVDRWSAAFGADAVVVFDYDGIRAKGLDIYKVLVSEVLGISDLEPSVMHLENKSIEPVDTELLRVLNALDKLAGNEPAAAIRTAFMANYENPQFAQICSQARRLIRQGLTEFGLVDLRVVRQIRREFRERHPGIRHPGVEDCDISLEMPNDRWVFADGARHSCLRSYEFLSAWLSRQVQDA
jgi:hypothetical protein